jgi:hypothetical protein
MTQAESLEQLAETLSPLDFPAGSLKVLWQDNLRIKFQHPAGCLGFTHPDADTLCGLGTARRFAAIVMNFQPIVENQSGGYASLQERFAGTLVHELAHLIFFPLPDLRPPLDAVSSGELRGALSESLEGFKSVQAEQAPYHDARWARILTHLFWRCGQLRLRPFHGSRPESAHMDLFADLLGGECARFYGRSLREVAAIPVPVRFARTAV